MTPTEAQVAAPGASAQVDGRASRSSPTWISTRQSARRKSGAIVPEMGCVSREVGKIQGVVPMERHIISTSVSVRNAPSPMSVPLIAVRHGCRAPTV